MATIRRLSDEDVRSIFESLHHDKPPPPHLKFQIVPVGPNGLKLSPPSYEFDDGLYILLRPQKKKKTGSVLDVPQPPAHLAHLLLHQTFLETCPWSLSGPQFPQPTAIQQRYCYPKGRSEYSSRKGGALWTMYGADQKEDLEYRLLHVYFSAKRAVNKGINVPEEELAAAAAAASPAKRSKRSPDRFSGVARTPIRPKQENENDNDVMDVDADYHIRTSGIETPPPYRSPFGDTDSHISSPPSLLPPFSPDQTQHITATWDHHYNDNNFVSPPDQVFNAFYPVNDGGNNMHDDSTNQRIEMKRSTSFSLDEQLDANFGDWDWNEPLLSFVIKSPLDTDPTSPTRTRQTNIDSMFSSFSSIPLKPLPSFNDDKSTEPDELLNESLDDCLDFTNSRVDQEKTNSNINSSSSSTSSNTSISHKDLIERLGAIHQQLCDAVRAAPTYEEQGQLVFILSSWARDVARDPMGPSYSLTESLKHTTVEKGSKTTNNASLTRELSVL